MIEEVKLPEISENVESGVVIAALVKAGDFVEKEQPLVELETEKATFEVPSPFSGKVVEISVNEEDEINVGQVIAKIDTDAEAARQQEQKPAEVETAPAPKEQEAPAQVTEKPKARQELPPQKPERIPAPRAGPEQLVRKKEPAPAKSVSAAPGVRRLARELGIDIAQVAGSGPGGRISAEDVKSYVRDLIAAGGAAFPGPISMPLPDFTKWGQVERQPMTVTRKKIAETLGYAWANVPHVTQYDQADITALEQFRAQYAGRVEQAGGKLTMTSILMKVVASALKTFPKFNASVDAERNEIIFKQYCHISVAVDTERGLLVPVVRDVDKKNILKLSVELKDIAAKARNNKLSPDEMTGGNFTISNLGGLGGTGFSPIIYWPQVAILGVARSRQQAGYVNGQIGPRTILPLSLSYDHRIIDGTDAVRFLRWIVETLEKPFLLAVEE
ncbi:MAG: 2-oxo acid dehydrogenase subunit E2 [Phycisphaerales bacterium]|nr:MAG: 2-oxo acid dehydrogenase subunit E2 [Phycisphaerales bacterium]